MKFKHHLYLWGAGASAATLIAILASIHQQLITVGPWVLDSLLAALGSLTIYGGFRVVISGRTHYLTMRAKSLEVQEQEQQIEHIGERNALELFGMRAEIHLKLSRIYADPNGNYPILLPGQFLTPAQMQGEILMLPPGQAKGIGTRSHMPALPSPADNQVQVRELPANVRYEDIRGQIPAGHSCLGISERGLETCDFRDLMTMLISGGSSTGKSNTVSIKLEEAMRIGRNTHIVVIDPHKNKSDSLYNNIRHYEPRFLCPVAQMDEDIIRVLKWFKQEFERRMGLTTEELEKLDDVLLVCDEVFALCFHREDDRMKKLIKLVSGIAGYESRGYGMYAWFLTQKVSGLKWLRDAVMTTICHKMQTMSERVLACNDDTTIARDMDKWTMRGRVVVFGLNLPVTVTQMPHKTVVEGSVQHPDEMEDLQPKPRSMEDAPIFRADSPLMSERSTSLPNSANAVFQTQQEHVREDGSEDNGEASGRRYTADDLMNPLVLKKFLNEAGKKRAEGMSIDAILKSYGMSPGGRNNQNLKALLDAQDEAAEG